MPSKDKKLTIFADYNERNTKKGREGSKTTACKYWIMIIKRKTLLVLSLLASGFLASCWDSFEERTFYAANVTAFGFSEHDTCPDIEDYVFNIDQYNGVSADTSTGTIYNLDSLPYGSVVNSLYPDVTFQSTNGNIYIADSLWEEDDSLDFTNPVILTNTSYDGLYTKRYTIYVNVHQVNPDSMRLVKMNHSLPFATGSNRMIAALGGGTLLNYASVSGGGLQLAVSDDTCKTWTEQPVSGLSGTMNLLSLCSFDSSYYITSASGQLYSSVDGQSWNSETVTVDGVVSSDALVTLYGDITKKYRDQTEYDVALIGLAKNSSGDICFARSINGIDWTTGSTIPADFPVSDYAFVKGSTVTNVQYYTVASGLNKSGSFSSSVFSTEDGLSWVVLDDGSVSRTGIPKRKGSSIFKYEENLVAFGGLDGSGVYQNDWHVSPDNGKTWNIADDSWVLTTMPLGLAYAGVYIVRVPDTVNDEDREFIFMAGGTNADGATSEVWKAFLYEMVFARR